MLCAANQPYASSSKKQTLRHNTSFVLQRQVAHMTCSVLKQRPATHHSPCNEQAEQLHSIWHVQEQVIQGLNQASKALLHLLTADHLQHQQAATRLDACVCDVISQRAVQKSRWAEVFYSRRNCCSCLQHPFQHPHGPDHSTPSHCNLALRPAAVMPLCVHTGCHTPVCA